MDHISPPLPRKGTIRVKRETIIMLSTNPDPNPFSLSPSSSSPVPRGARLADPSPYLVPSVTVQSSGSSSSSCSSTSSVSASYRHRSRSRQDECQKEHGGPPRKAFRKLSDASSLLSDIFRGDTSEDVLRQKIKMANEYDAARRMGCGGGGDDGEERNRGFWKGGCSSCYSWVRTLGRRCSGIRGGTTRKSENKKDGFGGAREKDGGGCGGETGGTTIRLPDSAVAGRTTSGGFRHIAISIPVEHAHVDFDVDDLMGVNHHEKEKETTGDSDAKEQQQQQQQPGALTCYLRACEGNMPARAPTLRHRRSFEVRNSGHNVGLIALSELFSSDDKDADERLISQEDHEPLSPPRLDLPSPSLSLGEYGGSVPAAPAVVPSSTAHRGDVLGADWYRRPDNQLDCNFAKTVPPSSYTNINDTSKPLDGIPEEENMLLARRAPATLSSPIFFSWDHHQTDEMGYQTHFPGPGHGHSYYSSSAPITDHEARLERIEDDTKHLAERMGQLERDHEQWVSGVLPVMEGITRVLLNTRGFGESLYDPGDYDMGVSEKQQQQQNPDDDKLEDVADSDSETQQQDQSLLNRREDTRNSIDTDNNNSEEDDDDDDNDNDSLAWSHTLTCLSPATLSSHDHHQIFSPTRLSAPAPGGIYDSYPARDRDMYPSTDPPRTKPLIHTTHQQHGKRCRPLPSPPPPPAPPPPQLHAPHQSGVHHKDAQNHPGQHAQGTQRTQQQEKQHEKQNQQKQHSHTQSHTQRHQELAPGVEGIDPIIRDILRRSSLPSSLS
ncbi:hypothetical protein QBC47DRAFT_145152 [Echria macrotheca]|uniref:Uncharacterized protein n=1 Tax=Echria macrotheca TaxID=438768 RepID=A0AAJ0FEW3_9PEZI|nr:hypothetical protein QBC47DRAFT_145152 [Echria macrotheca]